MTTPTTPTLIARLEALRDELGDSGAITELAPLQDLADLLPEVLAALRESERDAARYRWVRETDWFSSPLCVLRDPKRILTGRPSALGADCPSRDRLDTFIDAELKDRT